MALPKKGRRKIVVDGETYYWKVRPVRKAYEDSNLPYESALFIQMPSGKIKSITNITGNEADEVHMYKPNLVEKLVRRFKNDVKG